MDLNKIKDFLRKEIGKKGVAISSLCEKLEIKDYELLGVIELLKKDGFMIDVIGDTVIKAPKPQIKNDVYEIKSNLEHLKLLLLSDTHLGSKYDRLDILKYVYKKAEELGIQVALHSGDIVDGSYPNRSNQIYELKVHGADEQTDYVVQNYPTFDGQTLFITGNHDFTHIRNDGYNIGRAIAKQRNDMIYLGEDVADVKIGGLKIRLFHGAGRRAYSKSYKLQRYVETIPLEERPDIQAMGHFHDAFYMPYQGVHCFQVPALLDQTPFARQMGMPNLKGVWWIDVDFDKKGNVYSVKSELETFDSKVLRKKK